MTSPVSFISSSAMIQSHPDLVSVRTIDVDGSRTLDVRYRPAIPGSSGPGTPFCASFVVDLRTGRFAPARGARPDPNGAGDVAFGARPPIPMQEAVRRGLAPPDNVPQPGPDPIAELALGRRASRARHFVREHVLAAEAERKVAGFFAALAKSEPAGTKVSYPSSMAFAAEGIRRSVEVELETTPSKPIETCTRLIERKISAVFDAEIAPLLSKRDGRLLAVCRDAALFDWGVYEAVANNAATDRLCDFIARRPLVGIQTLTVPEALEAVASGVDDGEAFRIARARIGSREVSFGLDRWSDALFARVSGIVWSDVLREPHDFVRALAEIPIDWIPLESDYRAFGDVMTVKRGAMRGLRTARMPEDANLIRGCKGNWSAYLDRLKTAAGGNFWQFTLPVNPFFDTPEGRVRIRQYGLLRMVSNDFLRQIVVPVAALHAEAAPALHAKVTSSVGGSSRALMRSTNDLLFVGMDLPSRMNLMHRYSEAGAARRGAVKRHPRADRTPAKFILRPAIACTNEALRDVWKAWRTVVPHRLRVDDMAELARLIERDFCHDSTDPSEGAGMVVDFPVAANDGRHSMAVEGNE